MKRRCLILGVLFAALLVPAQAQATSHLASDTAWQGWQHMTDVQMLAKAQQRYDQTWRVAAPLYGTTGDTSPPWVRYIGDPATVPMASDSLTSGDVAFVTGCNGGYVECVNVSPTLTRMLATPRGRWLAIGKLVLLHEWAHIYQAAATNLAGSPYMEGGAEAFAEANVAYVVPYWRPTRWLRYAATPEYRSFVQMVQTTLGPSWIDHDQFGRNFAHAPRTLDTRTADW